MQCTIDVGAREQVCHQRTPSIFYTTATHRKKWNSSDREWSAHTSLWRGGGGGGVKQWKWNMGKKEKLLMRTHTCQPSGLFGFRTRFTFLLAGQADVFRIFCLWLLSVFHSASHCSRAKTKYVTHFSSFLSSLWLFFIWYGQKSHTVELAYGQIIRVAVQRSLLDVMVSLWRGLVFK